MVRTTAYGVLLALVLAAPAAAATTTPPVPEPVEHGGTRVEGGTPQDRTALTAGLWTDTLTGSGEDPANTRWFEYTRVMADSTVFVGAVATAVDPANDQIRVEVLTLEGEACGSYVDDIASSSPGQAIGVLKVVGPDEVGTSSTCSSAPGLRIAVSRGSTSGLTSSLPFTLRLVEEAPVSGDAGPEPADETSLRAPDPATTATPTAGGRSFDDAPAIDGTVSDTIPPGTERFFKVHLDWGQSLSWGVEVPTRPPTETYTLDPAVEVTLFDPLRAPFEAGAVDAEVSGSYGEEGASLADTTPQVAYLNRTATDDVAFVPGDYWVAVAVSPTPADQDPIDVPVELTVQVDGQGRQPNFATALTGPGSAPPPDGYDKTTPYLVAAATFSADVSGTPTGPDDAAAAQDDVRRIAGLAVGGGSLLALLAGAVLLRRRSRISPAATR